MMPSINCSCKKERKSHNDTEFAEKLVNDLVSAYKYIYKLLYSSDCDSMYNWVFIDLLTKLYRGIIFSTLLNIDR